MPGGAVTLMCAAAGSEKGAAGAFSRRLRLLRGFGGRHGLRQREEAFVVYGVLYAALGLCVFEVDLSRDTLLILLLELVTVVTAATLLWRWHAQLKQVKA